MLIAIKEYFVVFQYVTSHHPILANLKPDPANVQSSKQLVSKKTNATSSCAKNSVKASSSVSSVKTADKTSNVKHLMPSNRHDSTLSGRLRKRYARSKIQLFSSIHIVSGYVQEKGNYRS